jgi:hypothetical protein
MVPHTVHIVCGRVCIFLGRLDCWLRSSYLEFEDASIAARSVYMQGMHQWVPTIRDNYDIARTAKNSLVLPKEVTSFSVHRQKGYKDGRACACRAAGI